MQSWIDVSFSIDPFCRECHHGHGGNGTKNEEGSGVQKDAVVSHMSESYWPELNSPA